MKNYWSMLLLVVSGVMMSGCLGSPTTDTALWSLRAARRTIEQVDADRESAKELVPIQRRFCGTMGKLHDVESCQFTIRPEVVESKQLNDDRSVTYGLVAELRFTALITVKSAEAWSAEEMRREVSQLLLENGLRDFTIFPPLESGTTWIVTGWSSDPGKRLPETVAGEKKGT